MMVRSATLKLATFAATLALLVAIARPAHAQAVQFPALAPPSEVAAYPKDKAVFLSWTNLADPAVVGYNVWRRKEGDTPDKAVKTNAAAITTTYGTDTGLTNGTAYRYFVTAIYKDSASQLKEGLPSQDVPATAGNLGPFVLYNLDSPDVGSATIDANNVMTIRGGGQDIWDNLTQGTFLLAPVSGDFRITVKVTERPMLEDTANGDTNAKVGLVVLFGGLHHAHTGEFAYLYNSVDRTPEFLMEGRKPDLSNWGVSDNSPSSAETTFPAWLRITVKGSLITAAFSQDVNNPTFKDLGPAVDFGSAPLPALRYAGVAVTARKKGTFVVGKIDFNTLKIEAAP